MLDLCPLECELLENKDWSDFPGHKGGIQGLYVEKINECPSPYLSSEAISRAFKCGLSFLPRSDESRADRLDI